MDDFNVVAGVVAAIVLCGLAVVVCEIAIRRPRSVKEVIADLRRLAERPAAAPLAYQKKRGG